MAKQTVPQRFMTVPEAAQRLSMSAVYLRKLIREGRLPEGIVHQPIRGGHYRIDIEAFDEWVRNGCFTVAPDDDGGKVADRAPA